MPTEPHPVERHMPAVTKVQVVALVQAVGAVAVTLGVHLTDAQLAAIGGLSGLAFTVLVWADQRIRRHRAENLAPIFDQDFIDAALQAAANEASAAAGRPSARFKPAPLRQLEKIESEAAAAAEVEAEQPPPKPGSYPDEPTGS